jgi:dipeptidyl aminopeptidase/acylaminoacyl peptidase
VSGNKLGEQRVHTHSVLCYNPASTFKDAFMKTTSNLSVKKPFDVEDILAISEPSWLTVSPDGRNACVTVSHHDVEANSSRWDLWLAPLDGGNAYPLTRCGLRDFSPVWSPNGDEIAFIGWRTQEGATDEEFQLYVISSRGGEARRITTLPSGASNPRWFPDGKTIAFTSWVWPDARSAKEQEEKYRAMKASKVSVHATESTHHRLWDRWYTDGRVVHLFTVDTTTKKVRDLFQGTDYSLSPYHCDKQSFDISPRGKEIVFVCDSSKEPRWDNCCELVVASLTSKRFRSVASKPHRHYYAPRFSRDGKIVACLTSAMRPLAINQSTISLIDTDSGKEYPVTSSWDRSAEGPLDWSDDGSSLFFLSADKGRQQVYRVGIGPSASRKAPEMCVSGGTVSEYAVRNGVIAWIRSDISSPPGLYARALEGNDERRIEIVKNSVPPRVRLGEVREYTIKGALKDDVQLWVVYPPKYSHKKKWPLLHVIHGGPHMHCGDAWTARWNLQSFAAQGYVVAYVNFHGTLGFGEKFLQSIVGRLGTYEVQDIEAATDFLLKHESIDRTRLYASGGSYGGKLVALMNGRTNRYRAYVCHAGCFDWVSMMAADVGYGASHNFGSYYWEDPENFSKQSPLTYVKNAKTPTLITHGELDYRVPSSQGIAYYNTLKAKGVPTRLLHFPDENHWIVKPQNSRFWYREFFEWLKRYS